MILIKTMACQLVLIFGFISLAHQVFAADSKQAEAVSAWQEILEVFTRASEKDETYSVDLDALGWENPAPGILDLGLDKKNLAALIDDRIVLMLHQPKTIEVPYYGQMVRWHNARFVSAITKVPFPAHKLRELIIQNDQQNGWKNVEPFVKDTEVLYRSDAQTAEDDRQQIGLRYKIQAKISIIRVNGNFYARNRYEQDGDISSLFLNGDMGVSLGLVPIIPKAVLSPLTMANVRRWEFLPIDENSSLLAITDWAEVLDGSQLSKRMSQYDEQAEYLGGISDEDLVGPFPGVAVNLYNFKQTVLKLAGDEKGLEGEQLEKGRTPDFVDSLNVQDLEHLLKNGPVVFMHPKQFIDTEYGGYPLHFVSAAYPVNTSFDTLRRYSAQMNHYSEYVPQMSGSTLVSGSFAVPDFNSLPPDSRVPAADVDLTLSLGKRAKFISSFDIQYRMRYWWERPDRLAFEAIEGEIETVLGAVEWLKGSQQDKSILFYTTASDLGPKPKFPLNLSQKIPGADVASGVMVSVMAAGRQGPWVELQLEQEEARQE